MLRMKNGDFYNFPQIRFIVNFESSEFLDNSDVELQMILYEQSWKQNNFSTTTFALQQLKFKSEQIIGIVEI